MSPTMTMSSGATSTRQTGLQIKRHFTKVGIDPLSEIQWERRRAEIKGPDGKILSAMDDVEVPVFWSQTALDIATDKYFRKAGVPGRGHEHSVRQLVSRVAKAIRLSGDAQGGYFASSADADAFEAELAYMLVHQFGAFNSPVWFNVGLAEAYGIKGKPSGNYVWDNGRVADASDSYSRPAASACFIVSPGDDLIDIARHVEREMRIFRFGGGAGMNASDLRAAGEPLSNGGTSSGVMSFLKVYDASAGAIKSGGTTRRAAKLVCLDVDHPDIKEFITWKVKEEEKALALIRAGYPSDFNGEAYQTVGGQNANNSVRLSDEFMKAVQNDGQWETKWRTNGKTAGVHSAKGLFRLIAEASWRCADPGLMFDTTINRWNPVINTGRIRAANPCVEYHYLPDTACNLSSLNLKRFMQKRPLGGWDFDVESFRHAARIFTLSKEIIVDYASYPTQAIAQNSHDHRPLGLGYANLGAVLMIQGLPYDSQAGRAFGASVNSLLCGVAYETSAEIAVSKGPFAGFAHNREPMLRVLNMHREAAVHAVNDAGMFETIAHAGLRAWQSAIGLATTHGVRNGQVTVTAPTGTIALMMDCDTTGVEPEFSLVKSKKLAGGGYMKIANRSVGVALETLGYVEADRKAIEQHVVDAGTVEGCPRLKPEHLGVFDCASKSGSGTRFIAPMGHIRMLEAVQPFVSGSISKTVNCPEETTVDEIEQLHMEAWKRGLKCIAIYRDNSKHSQVLSATSGKGEKAAAAKTAAALTPPSVEVVVERPRDSVSDDDVHSEHGPPQTRRHRLQKPRRAGGDLFELKIGDQKLYLKTGEYADGSLGEVFIDLHKDGSTMRSMMNMFSIAVSLGLQHGVPLQEFVTAFTFQKFEPAGAMDHPYVKKVTSVVDGIFKVLALEYGPEDAYEEYAQVQPTSEELDDIRARRAIKMMLAQAHSKSKVKGQKTVVKHANGNGNGNGAMTKTGSFRRASVTEAQTCSRCGGLTQRTGTCHTCQACGTNTGC